MAHSGYHPSVTVRAHDQGAVPILADAPVFIHDGRDTEGGRKRNLRNGVVVGYQPSPGLRLLGINRADRSILGGRDVEVTADIEGLVRLPVCGDRPSVIGDHVYVVPYKSSRRNTSTIVRDGMATGMPEYVVGNRAPLGLLSEAVGASDPDGKMTRVSNELPGHNYANEVIDALAKLFAEVQQAQQKDAAGWKAALTAAAKNPDAPNAEVAKTHELLRELDIAFIKCRSEESRFYVGEIVGHEKGRAMIVQASVVPS